MSPLRQTAVARILLVISFILLLGISSRRPQSSEAAGGSSIFLPLIIRDDPFPRGTNVLANNSFEGGWYHPNGIPELQIPAGWTFTYEEGPTGFGSEPWDVWVRPEVRVLPSEQLPAHERPLFIWDGDQTVKIFKGFGAISYTLTQNVWLTPGTYIFEMSVFPDLVVGYNPDGSKIWAPDPMSGEVRLLAGNASTEWLLPTFGTKNTYFLVFHLPQAKNVQIGAALRGRWAIRNNGWFMDDWHLWRATGDTPPPGVYTNQAAAPIFAADYVPPAEPFIFPVGPIE